ncbi:fatty acyl-CoA reductase [Trichonephila clavipes]|nr:fatty acyl-CoA reductase [Trichonephila clavipes]
MMSGERDSDSASPVEEEGSQVAEFFKDRCVFITGVSGFVGKVLLEKLLRSCERVRTVYVLIRHKDGHDPRQRLDELFTCQFSVPMEQSASVCSCYTSHGDPFYEYKIFRSFNLRFFSTLPVLSVNMEDISAVKIPAFISSDPVLWFEMLESTFELAVPKPITEERAQYNYCVAHLSPDAAKAVRDVILSTESTNP